MDPSDQPVKRKRGRPRKNAEKIEPRSAENKEKREENIVLFLALSDEDSQNSEEDNRFTVNDSEPRTGNVAPLSDEESSDSNETVNINDKQLSVNALIAEIKKRDAIITRLQNRGGSILSSYNNNKPTNIKYHCVQMAESATGNLFSPVVSKIECWWCDTLFDNLPAYIPNYYRNGIFYVFGNFCSFNCALKYNIKMLKDFKCQTRQALINNLRMRTTGNTAPIRLADERELLVSKGGKITIEKFREGFSVITPNMKINIPPLIPLVHVIEEGRRD
jgi:hypothetical protein